MLEAERRQSHGSRGRQQQSPTRIVAQPRHCNFQVVANSERLADALAQLSYCRRIVDFDSRSPTRMPDANKHLRAQRGPLRSIDLLQTQNTRTTSKSVGSTVGAAETLTWLTPSWVSKSTLRLRTASRSAHMTNNECDVIVVFAQRRSV